MRDESAQADDENAKLCDELAVQSESVLTLMHDQDAMRNKARRRGVSSSSSSSRFLLRRLFSCFTPARSRAALAVVRSSPRAAGSVTAFGSVRRVHVRAHVVCSRACPSSFPELHDRSIERTMLQDTSALQASRIRSLERTHVHHESDIVAMQARRASRAAVSLSRSVCRLFLCGFSFCGVLCVVFLFDASSFVFFFFFFSPPPGGWRPARCVSAGRRWCANRPDTRVIAPARDDPTPPRRARPGDDHATARREQGAGGPRAPHRGRRP